jgi:hypothetical protein
MTPDEAKQLLGASAGQEDPMCLPPSVLKYLAIGDVPENTSIQVGVVKDNVIHLEWEGYLRNDSGKLIGEAEYVWTRKYWYSPIGLEQYLDLVRRAVEVRARTHGDVSAPEYDDDGAYIHLRFAVATDATNLGDAYHRVKSVCEQLEETPKQASTEIGKKISEVAARVSGWGGESLDVLVDAVETAKSTDDKGRSLEELFSRLLESIPGFSITGRIRTVTEEIDISVLNDSQDPRFRRELALILGECKNWSGKCGKNEFVIFKEKLENRNRRCSLGFLLSWNGFAETVTKEMLRGSKGELLIVPITGKEIRAAVRDKNFPDVLAASWDAAVNL